MRKEFKRALKKARLPEFRLYDLRHTYASLLLADNAPITYVSQQLGHANGSTTFRFYARWIPSRGKRWVDVLDRVTTAIQAAVGTRFGTRTNIKPESGVPVIWKRPIRLVGRQGLEPWTR